MKNLTILWHAQKSGINKKNNESRKADKLEKKNKM